MIRGSPFSPPGSNPATLIERRGCFDKHPRAHIADHVQIARFERWSPWPAAVDDAQVPAISLRQAAGNSQVAVVHAGRRTDGNRPQASGIVEGMPAGERVIGNGPGTWRIERRWRWWRRRRRGHEHFAEIVLLRNGAGRQRHKHDGVVRAVAEESSIVGLSAWPGLGATPPEVPTVLMPLM